MDGKGWMAETAFSFIKYRFGEYSSSIKSQNRVKEMITELTLYNLFISIV
jgi:hypothetical protein